MGFIKAGVYSTFINVVYLRIAMKFFCWAILFSFAITSVMEKHDEPALQSDLKPCENKPDTHPFLIAFVRLLAQSAAEKDFHTYQHNRSTNKDEQS